MVCPLACMLVAGLVGCGNGDGPSASPQELVYREMTYGPVRMGRIVRVTADGKNRHVLSEGGADLSPLYVSPDGANILFQVDANWFLLPSAGGTATPFTVPATGTSNFALSPSWAPDGASIAWLLVTGDGSLPSRIGVAPVGSATAHVITPDSLYVLSSSWSPDGSTLLFCSYNADRLESRLYTITPEGANLHAVNPDSIYVRCGASWNPAGTQIGFAGRDVWTIGADGNGLRRVTTGGAVDGVTSFDGFRGDVSWSPDAMYVLASGTHTNALIHVNIATGAQSPLSIGLSDYTHNPISPDGNHLVYIGRTKPDSVGNTGPAVVVSRADGTLGVNVSPDSVASSSPAWLPIKQ